MSVGERRERVDTPLSTGHMQDLISSLRTRGNIPSVTVGYQLPGQELTPYYVRPALTGDMTAAKLSVCGDKLPIAFEWRWMQLPSGMWVLERTTTDALILVRNSGRHEHQAHFEKYKALEGQGFLLWNDEIKVFKEGDEYEIPPGVSHGAFVEDPQHPLLVHLNFRRGIVPLESPNAAFLRDEYVYPGSSFTYAQHLRGMN